MPKPTTQDPRQIRMHGQRIGYILANRPAFKAYAEWAEKRGLPLDPMDVDAVKFNKFWGECILVADVDPTPEMEPTGHGNPSDAPRPEQGGQGGNGSSGRPDSTPESGDGETSSPAPSVPTLPDIPDPTAGNGGPGQSPTSESSHPEQSQGSPASETSKPGETSQGGQGTQQAPPSGGNSGGGSSAGGAGGSGSGGAPSSQDQPGQSSSVPSQWQQPPSELDTLQQLLGMDPSKPATQPQPQGGGQGEGQGAGQDDKPTHYPSCWDYLKFYASCRDHDGRHLPIGLIGPKGCGKTKMAELLAKALGLKFWAVSVTEGVSEEKLTGYPGLVPNADGSERFYPGPLLRAIVEGGVILLDEADAMNPNVGLSMNSILANGFIGVPGYNGGEVVYAHPDFLPVFSMNTFGSGASRQYVGRNAQDAAFLDRIRDQTIEVDYDEELEKKIAHPEAVRFGQLIRKRCRFGPDGKPRPGGWHRDISTRNILNWSAQIRAGATISGAVYGHFSDWTDEELRRVNLVRHREARYIKEA